MPCSEPGHWRRSARQTWLDLTLSPVSSHDQKVKAYLGAIESAGNAIACLTGMPLTTRRFFLQLPQRAQAIHHPELVSRLIALLPNAADQTDSHWTGWMKDWKEAFAAAAQIDNAPARLNAARLAYYENAANALWQEHPIASLWIVLHTWAMAANCLPQESAQIETWRSALQTLELDADHFDARLEDLDRTLDMLEELLERWGKENGAAIVV